MPGRVAAEVLEGVPDGAAVGDRLQRLARGVELVDRLLAGCLVTVGGQLQRVDAVGEVVARPGGDRDRPAHAATWAAASGSVDSTGGSSGGATGSAFAARGLRGLRGA